MQTNAPDTLHHIKLTHIRPRPVNRADLNLTDDFKESIRSQGVQVPIMVRKLPEPAKDGVLYEIVFGERRWAASGAVGHATIPAMVRAMDDKEAGEAQLVENLQHEGFTALDEANLYQERLKSGVYGTGKDAVKALAEAIKMGASTIYARLRLLTLPKPVRDAMSQGKIEASVADLIATIPDAKQQEAALAEIAKGETQWNQETNKQERHPLSYRKAKALVEEEFRKSLKDAPFDLKQTFPGNGPGLVRDALPSCEACPKRTGNIAGLPSGSAPNVCTDPKCYALKVERHSAALLQKHKDAGHAVLEGDKAKGLFQYGSLAYNAPYVSADHNLWIKDKNIKVTKALGKKMPAPVYAVDPKGAVVALYPEAAVNEALIAAKLVKPPERKKAKSKEDKAKREMEEQQRVTEVDRIMDACMKVVENPKLSDRVHALLWNYVITRLLSFDASFSHICARRKISQETFTRSEVVDPKGDLHLEICRGLAMEILISSNYEDEFEEECLNDLAKLCGVDTASIAKEVAAEFKAREKKAAAADAKHPVTKAKKIAAKGKARK